MKIPSKKKISLLLDDVNAEGDGGIVTHNVGEVVSRMLYKSNYAWIASPYISDIRWFHYDRMFNNCKVKILCNIDSLGCNPHKIKELCKKGAMIWTYNKLHAKAYICEMANEEDNLNYQYVVTSGNFTENGLGKGNVDCGIYRRFSSCDGIEKIRTWFEDLCSISTKLGKRYDWESAYRRWENRQYWRKIEEGVKPDFLEALENGEIDKGEIGFALCDVSEVSTSKKNVRNALQIVRNIRDDYWDFFVDGTIENRPRIESIKKQFIRKKLLILPYTSTENNPIKKITPKDIEWGKIVSSPYVNKKDNEYCTIYTILQNYREYDYGAFAKKLLSAAQTKEGLDLFEEFTNGEKMGYCTVSDIKKLLKKAQCPDIFPFSTSS